MGEIFLARKSETFVTSSAIYFFKKPGEIGVADEHEALSSSMLILIGIVSLSVVVLFKKVLTSYGIN